MFRKLFAFSSICIALTACATAPSVTSPGGMVKYGAGSLDEQTPAPAPAKAAAPAPVKKIQIEEILAQTSGYEADMDSRLAGFDFAAALASYDSVYSVLSGIPEGKGRLAELRVRLDRALDALGFEAVAGPAETVAGTAFKKDFTGRVFVTVSGEKKPLAGFDAAVFFPSVATDGAKVILSEQRESGPDGLLAFSAPVPAASGKNRVVFSSVLTSKDPELAAILKTRAETGNLAVSFPHVVSSSAKRVGTSISIIDFDKNGKLLSSNISATTLLKPLVQKGYSRIGMADFPKQLSAGDEEGLLKAAKAQFGSGVQRFIYGTVRITEAVQGTDLLWSCTIQADVSVWDFVLGAKVYHTLLVHTEAGKTEAAAIDAARKKLAGDLLVNDLNYNM